MTEPKPKPQRDTASGRFLPANTSRMTHGAASFLRTGRVPSIRGKRRIQKRLNELRAALIEATPGSEDPRKLVLIGQIVEAQGFVMIIGEYVKRAGVLRPDKFRRGLLELQPVLGSVASFMGAQRAAILALGLDSKKGAEILTPYEIVEKEGRDKA